MKGKRLAVHADLRRYRQTQKIGFNSLMFYKLLYCILICKWFHFNWLARARITCYDVCCHHQVIRKWIVDLEGLWMVLDVGWMMDFLLSGLKFSPINLLWSLWQWVCSPFLVPFTPRSTGKKNIQVFDDYLSVCQLIPLQAPLKTMLQMSVVPLINSKSVTVCVLWYCMYVVMVCFVTVCFCEQTGPREALGSRWLMGWISLRRWLNITM